MTTSRKLDREQQDEHILEVSTLFWHIFNPEEGTGGQFWPLFHEKIISIILSDSFEVKTFNFQFKETEILSLLRRCCRRCKKGPFGIVPPCSDFRMGWEREVGVMWEILVTVPLFFPTVPSRGWSKPGQETVFNPTGRCLNLWVLIEQGSVLS